MKCFGSRPTRAARVGLRDSDVFRYFFAGSPISDGPSRLYVWLNRGLAVTSCTVGRLGTMVLVGNCGGASARQLYGTLATNAGLVVRVRPSSTAHLWRDPGFLAEILRDKYTPGSAFQGGLLQSALRPTVVESERACSRRQRTQEVYEKDLIGLRDTLDCPRITAVWQS